MYDVDLYTFDLIFFVRADVFLGPWSVILTENKSLVTGSRKVDLVTVCLIALLEKFYTLNGHSL